MHHPLLTIGETLEFSLGMNMKSNATKAEKEQRIFAIAEVLRLINIMNLQVGDENVTNAARKLLSIGVEMMKMPKILILDGELVVDYVVNAC